MTDSEKIDIVLTQILKNEGGYVNNPADSGGETNYGISKRAHPHEDIKAMTKERARQIYLIDYVLPLYDYIAQQNINYQYQVVDTAVNCGVSRAKKFAQITKDVEQIKQLRIEYYNEIATNEKAQFLKGWLKRVNINF